MKQNHIGITRIVWILGCSIVYGGIAQDQVASNQELDPKITINSREVLVNSPRGRTPVKLTSTSRDLSDGRFVVLNVLFDQDTGYFWWSDSYLPNRDARRPQLSGAWYESFWVIPDLGMLRATPGPRGLRLEISQQKTVNIEAAQVELFDYLSKRADEKPESDLRARSKTIRLDSILGTGFFSRPGDAAPQPPLNVLSINYTNGMVEVEMESGVTHEKATITLNKNFELVGH